MLYLRSTDEMMKEVVICKSCSSEEYYGMMYWHNGKVICRRCMYTIWEAESDWERGDDDLTFPLYGDGIDYTKK